MIRISVSYERGDCYTCDDVTKIVYTDVIGTEMTVEGEELLNHHFPIGRTLWVHSSNGTGSVSGSGIRAIDVYEA